MLVAKAKILEDDEAIIVLDDVLSAIKGATAGDTALRTRQAAVGVVAKLDHLCALERYAEAQEVGSQLSDVLGHVPVTSSPSRALTAPAASESLLAAAVAELVNDDDCWAVFEAPERISQLEAAERARGLYCVSDPWALSTAATETVNAAAAIVRIIADGYALLAGEWSAAERGSLPLPQRAESERHQFIREHGVEVWAKAHGHPLSLHVHDTDDVQPPTPSSSPTQGAGPDAVPDPIRDIMKCLYVYELTRVLSQSEEGLEALLYKQFAAISSSYVRFALDWQRKLATEGVSDGRVGVLIACWLIAQGFFEITHQQSGSAPPLFPAEEPLRDFLRETGGYAWLADRKLPLPAWTHTRDT